MRTIEINGEKFNYEIYSNGFAISIFDNWEEYYEPYIPNKFLSYEENVKRIICDRLGVAHESKDLIEQTTDITNSQLTIMEAIATQYEENLENQLIQMDVLATIYETQLESMEGVE